MYETHTDSKLAQANGRKINAYYIYLNILSVYLADLSI